MNITADDIILRLDLMPHPEGGHFRQTWISDTTLADGRASGTCIHFLLKAGERSHWHRVDATEIWLFHAGAPLVLSTAESAAGPAHEYILAPEPGIDTGPQAIVPPHFWQAARSTGDWTLVSCTASPGFRFEGFELADQDFDIPR